MHANIRQCNSPGNQMMTTVEQAITHTKALQTLNPRQDHYPICCQLQACQNTANLQAIAWIRVSKYGPGQHHIRDQHLQIQKLVGMFHTRCQQWSYLLPKEVTIPWCNHSSWSWISRRDDCGKKRKSFKKNKKNRQCYINLCWCLQFFTRRQLLLEACWWYPHSQLS